MIEPQTLILFIITSVLLTLAPGPDIIYLIAQGATQGRKAGLMTALGFAFGNLVHTGAAALGVSVIFKTSSLAFHSLQIIGILYLLYLAWSTIKHSKTSRTTDLPAIQHQSWFWRPFIMNVLNPKVILFFLAFLPQFVDPQLSLVSLQMLILGLVFIGVVIVVFGSIGLIAGSLFSWVYNARKFRLLRYSPWVISAVYIYLAIHVALTRQI